MAPPLRNQKVTATRQDVAAGGPAANAAVTAAALGVRAVLITALGQGPVAVAARADLEAHGVEILDVAAPDFPLAVSAVLVDERTGERSVVSPDGVLAVAPPPSAAALVALPRPDAVLFDGHHPEIARAVLAHVTASTPRPQVVLDAGRWRPIFAELIPHADVAALSADFRVPDDDAAATAHTPVPHDVAAASTRLPVSHDADAATVGIPVPDDDAATARAVLARGAGAVVVTHGPDPVEWCTPTAAGTIPVPPTEARDTLGAGDAFHGALTAAIAHGDDLSSATTSAVRVASARVSQVGPRAWLRLGVMQRATGTCRGSATP